MDVNKILFRASGNGNLMIEPRSKSETISETTKTYLTEVFINYKFNRQKEISNKYLEKGLSVEEKSLTLLSLIEGKFYKKNELWFKDEYFSGTPDIIDGDTVIDIKSSYDIFTFYNSKKEINKNYFYQLQTYMALTGTKKAELIFCLVNGTFTQLNDEIRRLSWKMGILDASVESDETFINQVKKLERNFIFDIDDFLKENPQYEPKNKVAFNGLKFTWDYDIPPYQRIHKIKFDIDMVEISKMKSKVLEARKYIQNALILTLRNK